MRMQGDGSQSVICIQNVQNFPPYSCYDGRENKN